MKKLAIFLAIMLIPFSAFALDTISDSDLDSVTGQAGVSIFTNSIQIVKTGVTTTYTDLNGAGNANATVSTNTAGDFSVVSNQAVTQIYFKGYDPINIDVIDVADAVSIINAAAEAGAAATIDGTGGTTSFYGGSSDAVTSGYDVAGLGLSGVQITLPNMIEIQNLGTQKTYYATNAAGITAGEDSLIQVTTTGGVTQISIAVQEAKNVPALGMTTAQYIGLCESLAWSNAGDAKYAAAGIDHADQIKILITSHE